MSRGKEWGGGRIGAVGRIAPSPYASTVVAVGLVVLAVGETIARAELAVRSELAAHGELADLDTRFAFALMLLAVATTLPVLLLGPVGAALTVTAAVVASLALFETLTVAGGAALLLALYRLGRDRSPGRRTGLLAPGLATPFVAMALAGPRPSDSGAGVLTLLLAALGPAAGWAGIAHRARREVTEGRADRQVIAGNLLEHTARAERARIAHELHDVVAHHISMVAVQAETARLTTPGMPAAGAERLSAIGDTARTALTEMRRLLGVLREDTGAATRTGQRSGRPAPAEPGSGTGSHPTAPDRRPQPGLGQLNELLDDARAASRTGIRLIVAGAPIRLDPGTELAAYRIVQEALTNARRHAPGAAVDVELRYTDDVLRVRVRDNGPGPMSPAPTDGHGLPGMRERAVAVGGRLQSGPAGVGGFVVEATLPVHTGVDT